MKRRHLFLVAFLLMGAGCGKESPPLPETATPPSPPPAAPAAQEAAPVPMPAPTPQVPAPATPEVAPPPKPQAAPAPAKPTPPAPVKEAVTRVAPEPAAAPAANPALEAAKAKYAGTCAGCHGKNGQGAGAFPKLAGQSAADLAAKLTKYKAGEKIGPQSGAMFPFAKALSEAEIEQIAAHIASF